MGSCEVEEQARATKKSATHNAHGTTLSPAAAESQHAAARYQA